MNRRNLEPAENMLISQAQTELKNKSFESLLPETVRIQGVKKGTIEIIVMGGG